MGFFLWFHLKSEDFPEETGFWSTYPKNMHFDSLKKNVLNIFVRIKYSENFSPILVFLAT